MIIRQFVSQRTQMFLSIYLIIFPRVHFIYSVFRFLAVLKAHVHWSIWFPQRDTTKLKGEVLPVPHLWLAAEPSFWRHGSLSTPGTLHFFLSCKMEDAKVTKLKAFMEQNGGRTKYGAGTQKQTIKADLTQLRDLEARWTRKIKPRIKGKTS